MRGHVHHRGRPIAVARAPAAGARQPARRQATAATVHSTPSGCRGGLAAHGRARCLRRRCPDLCPETRGCARAPPRPRRMRRRPVHRPRPAIVPRRRRHCARPGSGPAHRAGRRRRDGWPAGAAAAACRRSRVAGAGGSRADRSAQWVRQCGSGRPARTPCHPPAPRPGWRQCRACSSARSCERPGARCSAARAPHRCCGCLPATA